MAEASWDVIIVGQGLAGTTLAWCLREAGCKVLVLDACEPVTSSKIAAGLMTPITGKRLALSRRFDAFFAAACEFYRTIEQRTGQTFFHERVALRLFRSNEEQENWTGRARRPDYLPYLLKPQPAPVIDPRLSAADHGGFAMYAAQLDVASYLEASITVLDWEPMTLDWRRDVSFSGEGVTVAGHRTRRLISCEGYAAARNPYFAWVPFIAAKGDILTVRFHSPVPPQSLHAGIWIAPTREENVFRVGSTYDWETLDCEPSASSRQEIETRLKAVVHVPYTVLDHRAAVRPIISESRAFIGTHPEHDNLGYFNGLGSKGSLHAPLYAHHLTQHLVHRAPLPAEMDVRQHFANSDARH